MLRLEPRAQRSRFWGIAAPVLAVALTAIASALLLAMLGHSPVDPVFIRPLTTMRTLPPLFIKASPLILIAVGLCLAFRANVWNIGAEGQYTIGALAGGAVALSVYPGGGPWLLPAMGLAAILAGAGWAMIPAILRTRFGVSEVLVSLMLSYVAVLLLSVALEGRLRDPGGFNFPQSRLLQPAARMPVLLPGLFAGASANVHAGFLVAIVTALAARWALARHLFGYQLRLIGDAPPAATFAGFSRQRIVWSSMSVSGALAGLAGVFEAAGPIGQLVPQLPSGYGFTAIIVALLARLNPLACIPAGLLLAFTYLGAEAAQMAFGSPSSVGVVFQGLLLVFVLAADVLASHRLRWRRAGAAWRF